jgi:hypothetical protein
MTVDMGPLEAFETWWADNNVQGLLNGIDHADAQMVWVNAWENRRVARGMEISGWHQCNPETQPEVYTHALLTVGVGQHHATSERVVLLRATMGESRFEFRMWAENARLAAQGLDEAANWVVQDDLDAKLPGREDLMRAFERLAPLCAFCSRQLEPSDVARGTTDPNNWRCWRHVGS